MKECSCTSGIPWAPRNASPCHNGGLVVYKNVASGGRQRGRDREDQGLVGVARSQALLTAYIPYYTAPGSHTGDAKDDASKCSHRQGMEEDAMREGSVNLDGWGGYARQNVPFLRALVVAHVSGAKTGSVAALML